MQDLLPFAVNLLALACELVAAFPVDSTSEATQRRSLFGSHGGAPINSHRPLIRRASPTLTGGEGIGRAAAARRDNVALHAVVNATGKAADVRDFVGRAGSVIWCGGHHVDRCSGCPRGRGDAWCNGDCEWSGECRFRKDLVWCGAHSASNCAACLNEFDDEHFCRGDCAMDQGICARSVMARGPVGNELDVLAKSKFIRNAEDREVLVRSGVVPRLARLRSGVSSQLSVGETGSVDYSSALVSQSLALSLPSKQGSSSTQTTTPGVRRVFAHRGSRRWGFPSFVGSGRLLEGAQDAWSKELDDAQGKMDKVHGQVRWARYLSKCFAVAADGTLQIWECAKGNARMQLVLPGEGSSGQIEWAADRRKCLSVVGGQPVKGAQLQFSTCSEGHGSTMLFTATTTGSGPIRWAPHPSMCLYVAGGSVSNGAKVQLWDCVPDQLDMQFSIRMEGQIVWATRHSNCLDVQDSNASPDDELVLLPCVAGRPSAQFIFPAPGTAGEINMASNPQKCLKVGGTRVTVGDCGRKGLMTGNRTKQFVVPAGGTGEIVWAADRKKCLDIASWRSNQILQISTCKLGANNMQFSLQVEGDSTRCEVERTVVGNTNWVRSTDCCAARPSKARCADDFVISWTETQCQVEGEVKFMCTVAEAATLPSTWTLPTRSATTPSITNPSQQSTSATTKTISAVPPALSTTSPFTQSMSTFTKPGSATPQASSSANLSPLSTSTSTLPLTVTTAPLSGAIATSLQATSATSPPPQTTATTHLSMTTFTMAKTIEVTASPPMVTSPTPTTTTTPTPTPTSMSTLISSTTLFQTTTSTHTSTVALGALPLTTSSSNRTETAAPRPASVQAEAQAAIEKPCKSKTLHAKIDKVASDLGKILKAVGGKGKPSVTGRGKAQNPEKTEVTPLNGTLPNDGKQKQVAQKAWEVAAAKSLVNSAAVVRQVADQASKSSTAARTASAEASKTRRVAAEKAATADVVVIREAQLQGELQRSTAAVRSAVEAATNARVAADAAKESSAAAEADLAKVMPLEQAAVKAAAEAEADSVKASAASATAKLNFKNMRDPSAAAVGDVEKAGTSNATTELAEAAQNYKEKVAAEGQAVARAAALAAKASEASTEKRDRERLANEAKASLSSAEIVAAATLKAAHERIDEAKMLESELVSAKEAVGVAAKEKAEAAMRENQTAAKEVMTRRKAAADAMALSTASTLKASEQRFVGTDEVQNRLALAGAAVAKAAKEIEAAENNTVAEVQAAEKEAETGDEP
eukprot:TRINITY_DN21215_c0_g1_i1.p1 TRINITY_DN21215_c0_g1~~TRINITY_DN21215_c0_g1_i1.p1  ORF type:complete len:1281 (-),score=257.65 TRINITY_DN21215_c0_g1_i1:330-4124(-)